MRVRGFCLLAVQIFVCIFAKTCIRPTPLTMQLILEYSKFRAWDEVVMFTEIQQKNCVLSYARPLLECLSANGISISFQSATNSNIPEALGIRGHRIGAIVILDGLNLTSPDNVLHVASQKQLYSYYVSWFLITVDKTDATIDTILRDLNIGINSEVVVATSALTENAATGVFQRWNKTCPSFRGYSEKYRGVGETETVHRKVENSTTNLSFAILQNRTTSFYFLHVYKIRTANNASLVTNFLGTWNPGSPFLRNPVSVKLRGDFRGLPLVFGVLNGSKTEAHDDGDFPEANDVTPFIDFAEFLTSSLNASMETVSYEKLGSLTNKAWSHLLGDVTQGTVDVGLGYITVSDDMLADMSFSHPLIRYMRNVYYRPLETSTMRDIFLRPFNTQLFACVAVTYIIILIAMIVIIHIAKIILNGQNEKIVGYGEAALCCISVMCMQGSTWSPKSLSGKTLLLFSLMFALVTYNAYAGFITSTLSVQENGIKSILDLLDNHFQLGYSAADDEYIRNANDPNLRLFYVKAFNGRGTNLGTANGLKRVVKGRYGFFVSATLARRALQTTIIQERCSIQELPLAQTFTRVALPMANTCPYKKIIDLNILRIKERGVFSRIAEKTLPEMPRCTEQTTFNSARLADVYSAFILLLGGIVVSFSIGIFERMWNKRKQMQESIVRGIREHHFIPHIHFHHHHHHQQQQQHRHHENHDNQGNHAGHFQHHPDHFYHGYYQGYHPPADRHNFPENPTLFHGNFPAYNRHADQPFPTGIRGQNNRPFTVQTRETDTRRLTNDGNVKEDGPEVEDDRTQLQNRFLAWRKSSTSRRKGRNSPSGSSRRKSGEDRGASAQNAGNSQELPYQN